MSEGAVLEPTRAHGDDDPRLPATPVLARYPPWLAIRLGGPACGAEPCGVAVLAFGIGWGGAAWLRGVEASAWFDGLRPDDADLMPGPRRPGPHRSRRP